MDTATFHRLSKHHITFFMFHQFLSSLFFSRLKQSHLLSIRICTCRILASFSLSSFYTILHNFSPSILSHPYTLFISCYVLLYFKHFINLLFQTKFLPLFHFLKFFRNEFLNFKASTAYPFNFNFFILIWFFHLK